MGMLQQSVRLVRNEGLSDYSSILGFSSSPTRWTECLGQRSLASFPPWFHKGIANLHVLLLPLLQNEILSVHQRLSYVIVPFATA